MTTQPFGGGGVDTITGGVNNYVMTAFDADTIQGEANLQFDGSTLTVNGAAVFNESSADVDFRIESNGNANMFFVDASTDRIGIGTNAPSSTVEIASSDAGTLLELSSWDADTVANSGSIRFQKSASNTIQTFAATGDGEYLGTLGFYGADTAPSASQRSAGIDVIQDGSASSAQVASDMLFLTGTSSAAATERMRITSAGNVGIGGSGNAIDHELHVENSSSNSTPTIKLENDAQGYRLQINGGDSDKLQLMETTGFDTFLQFNPSTKDVALGVSGNEIELRSDVTISGTTPTLTIGDAGAEDTAIVFDGNAVAYHIGLEDSGSTYDYFRIGAGNALGTTPVFTSYRDPAGHNVLIQGEHVTTGYVMDVQVGSGSSLTTGNLARFYSNNSNTNSRNLVEINQDHASASGTVALYVKQDGGDYALHVDAGVSRFDGAVDIQGGYANDGGAPYDGVVDAGGGGNWTTAQAGDDALDGGTYTMLVKQGAYSTLTVSTNNAKIVVEPASSFSGAITLSGHNITLVLGTGCAMSGLITMSGTNCSLIGENGIETIGILMSGADGYVDGGGWDTIANGGTARNGITISGADCIVENIAAITTAGGGEAYDAINVTSGGDRAIIRNVQVTDSDDDGIYIAGDDVLIEGCVMLGSDAHGIVPAAPRNRILGNYLINVGGIGIATGSGGDDSVINGNVIKDQASQPWYIDASSENCVVVGNRGDGAGVDNSGTSTVASNDETAF